MCDTHRNSEITDYGMSEWPWRLTYENCVQDLTPAAAERDRINADARILRSWFVRNIEMACRERMKGFIISVLKTQHPSAILQVAREVEAHFPTRLYGSNGEHFSSSADCLATPCEQYFVYLDPKRSQAHQLTLTKKDAHAFCYESCI
jgi:hypothetical protein